MHYLELWFLAPYQFSNHIKSETQPFADGIPPQSVSEKARPATIKKNILLPLVPKHHNWYFY